MRFKLKPFHQIFTNRWNQFCVLRAINVRRTDFTRSPWKLRKIILHSDFLDYRTLNPRVRATGYRAPLNCGNLINIEKFPLLKIVKRVWVETTAYGGVGAGRMRRNRKVESGEEKRKREGSKGDEKKVQGEVGSRRFSSAKITEESAARW